PVSDLFGAVPARFYQSRDGLVAHLLQLQLRIDAQKLSEADIHVDELARRFDGADAREHAAHRRDAHQILPGGLRGLRVANEHVEVVRSDDLAVLAALAQARSLVVARLLARVAE